MSTSKKLLTGVAAVLLLLSCGIKKSYAVGLDGGDWKFGVNGFLDLEYSGMDKAPMITHPGEVMTKTDDMSSFDQHINLLVNAARDRTSVTINLEGLHDYTGEGQNGIAIEEGYGVYSFSDTLKLHAGLMLAPFGIYNATRYITPLFASVVLPQMYQMPSNYHLEDISVNSTIMPYKANLMISGTFSTDSADFDYYLYMSNGENELESAHVGSDTNNDKGYGGRVRVAFADDYLLGASYWTVNNSPADVGRENLIGLDTELNFSEELKLEIEYVADNYGVRKERHSYYARLTREMSNKISPFIAYDFAHDDSDDVYNRGQTRYSVGFGYRLSSFTTLKAGYHYHVLGDKNKAPALPDGSDTFGMIKAAVIFVF
ncbi:MAG: hypothetical protein IEMM0002_1455 [bacterium]|nr:MAG: hypothetical protein IEMM0002_1455 [bacterium]